MTPDDDDRTVVMKKPADDSANALPPGTRLHEFEILGLVGEGGFGIVYLAEDVILKRRVALKEYLPSSLARRGDGLSVTLTSTRYDETFQLGLRSFINEAQMLARFDHPALVKVYRFWEANGTAYMVMPFYEGATFKQMVQRDGPPDEARLKTLLAQLLEALEVLHGVDCVHRDVAPDNVLMLASNRPVLLDFGAARQVITDRTQALTVILKPGYAPIEQYAEIEGLKQGPWTDVYALAGVAHYAITGSPPPPSIGRTLRDPYVPLAQSAAGRYSPAFLQAIDRALSVKPEDRPQSVAEFRTLLGEAPVIAPTTAFHDARTVAAPPPAARKKGAPAALWIGGWIAVVAGLAGGAFYYSRQEAAAPTPTPQVQETPAPKAPPVAETPAPPKEAPVAETPAPPPQVTAQPEPPAPPVQATPVEPPVAKAKPEPPPKPTRSAKAAEPKERVAKREAAPRTEAPAPAPVETPQPAQPSAANQLAAIAAATLDDGDKCMRAKQYDCAIANANSALRVDPTSSRAKRLKSEAEDAQRRALSSIKIE